MTPEGKVKAAIKRILAAHGCWDVMMVPTGYGKKGVPDFLVCHRGRFIAIEAKAGAGTPSPHQEREIAAILAAGGIALVVNETNLHEVEDVLVRGE